MIHWSVGLVILAAAGCGDSSSTNGATGGDGGAGGVSGTGGDMGGTGPEAPGSTVAEQTLAELDEAEAKVLCAWGIALSGHAASYEETCGTDGSVKVATSADLCAIDLAKDSCATATVKQLEACAKAIGEDLCKATWAHSVPAACTALGDCRDIPWLSVAMN